MMRISDGDSDRSFGTKVAIDAGPTSSAGLATFSPCRMAKAKTSFTMSLTWTAVAGAPRSFTFAHSPRRSSGRISGRQPVAKRRKNVALEDRSTHGPRAVGHPRFLKPSLAELAEALRLLEATLLALLLLCRRAAFRNGAPGIDTASRAPEPETGRRGRSGPASTSPGGRSADSPSGTRSRPRAVPRHTYRHGPQSCTIYLLISAP